jgi:tetratricopeptide (TPR) repeat protein
MAEPTVSSLRLPAWLRRPAVAVALLTAAAAAVAVGTSLTMDAAARARWRERTLPELEAEARTHIAEKYLFVQLAVRQVEAHEFGRAATSFQKAAEAGLNDPRVWQAWAAAAAASGDRKRAEGVLQLGARDPVMAAPLHAAAERAQIVGADASPVTIAEAISPGGLGAIARLTRPNFVSPWLERAGRRDPATSGFATREAWAKEKPDDPAVQVLWARALAANRRFPDAENVLLPILTRDKTNVDAALALADVRYAAGVPARAGILYRACLKERPNSFEAALGVARCAVDVKLIYLGVEASEKAIALNPKSADAWICLGRAYFNQKLRWDKAVDAFARAQALDPGRTDFYAPYYDSLRSSGKVEEGEKVLRARLARAPDDALAHYLLATALLDYRADTGTIAEAEKALRRSIQLQPDVPSSRTRLAQILLDRGDAKEASDLLAQAVILDPYYALARRLLARAYRLQKLATEADAMERSSKALDAYLQKKQPLEDALGQNPSDPALHEKLARIYTEGGEQEKAENSLKMAFMLRNHKQDAEAGLSRLMTETSLSAATEWDNARTKPPAKTP